MPTEQPDTYDGFCQDEIPKGRLWNCPVDFDQANQQPQRHIYRPCHADDVIHPGAPVVLYARVSGRTQARQRSLERQIAELEADAARLGADIVGTCAEVASGMSPDRPVLLRAAAIARRHNAIILAHNVGRFVRSGSSSTARGTRVPNRLQAEVRGPGACSRRRDLSDRPAPQRRLARGSCRRNATRQTCGQTENVAGGASTYH